MLIDWGASPRVGKRVGWSLCACNTTSSDGMMDYSQHHTSQASVLLLRESIRQSRAPRHRTGYRILQEMPSVIQHPKPLPSGAEPSARQCTCGHSPPFGSSEELPNPLEASCASCLATRAASGRRYGRRKAQKRAVDTDIVPLSLLPEHILVP